MPQLGPTEATDRGFPVLRFEDYYSNECSLQCSSLATQPAIWLGVDEPAHGGTRMHLTRPQVEALISHLTCWLETETFQ